MTIGIAGQGRMCICSTAPVPPTVSPKLGDTSNILHGDGNGSWIQNGYFQWSSMDTRFRIVETLRSRQTSRIFLDRWRQGPRKGTAQQRSDLPNRLRNSHSRFYFSSYFSAQKRGGK